MARVRKDVWRPGRYLLADGREWVDTPEDVRNGYEQGRKMLESGLHVPLCWEHQSKATPVYLSDLRWSDDERAAFAKHTFGHVTDYELEGDTLYAVAEIPNASDLDQFKKTRFVSPRLNVNARDPRGNLWPGKTVAHVAATSVPVQADQSPVDFSSLAGWSAELAVNLSELEPMDKSGSKSGASGKASGEDTDNKPAANAGGASSDQLNIGEMVELLRTAGFELGEPRNGGEFMAALTAAVKTKQGAEGMGQDANPTATAVVDAAGPPALMSTLPQPVQEGLRANLDAERSRWVERIDRLFASGRVNGPIVRELKAKATAAELSYGAGWKVERAPWMADVEAYEKLPEKTFHAGNGGPKDGGADLSNVAEVERPELGGSDGEARQKRLADETEARVKRKFLPSPTA